MQDVALTISRPGSWEGANMRQVLTAHGYEIVEGQQMTGIRWKRDTQFWSADPAEKAIVGKFELVAFDIPPSLGLLTREIGWADRVEQQCREDCRLDMLSPRPRRPQVRGRPGSRFGL